MKQLGDVLLERGLATPEQVYEAGQEQRRVGRSMGRVLVDQGVISEADLVRALAAQIGLDYVDLGDALIDPSASALVPGAVCRRHMLVPVRLRRRQARHRDGRPGERHRPRRRPLDRQGRPQAGRVDPWRRHGGDRARLPSRRRARQPEHGHRGPQHRRGGPHPDQGGRRGSPDRQVREPADHPGDPGRRLGHPHRAGRARPARALPHRRRAARDDALAEVDPVRGHQPAEDHGRHQHRRATDPPGRATVGECLRPQSGPARGHPAHGVGREGRHAHPGQLHRHAGPQGPRVHAAATSTATRPATSSPTG